MNRVSYRKIIPIITCLFSIFSTGAIAQNKSQEGTGEVSEIIIPTSARIQNNFNLFYEIHLSREDIPSPSFWYKIIFNKACSFEFTLIPLSEDDRYDFYFFKIESNYDFCNAAKEEKIISCNASRIRKIYYDTEQSEKFRSNLVDIKPIPVKAGDAIYIEVFSTLGHDCGHILDFRTTASSFVVKVVNDNCSENIHSDTTVVGKYKPLVIDEKQAIDAFSNTLCPPNQKPLFISSIKVDKENASVQKKLDFVSYSKAEAYKYAKPKPDSVKKYSETIKSNENDIVSKKLKPDSVKNFQPKKIAITDTLNIHPIIKSTADLNSIEETGTPIKQEIVSIHSDKERNGTRLEVDYVLFSLLREDLKRKTKSIAEQLEEYNAALKRTKEKEKKAEVFASIKDVKQQKSDIQIKIKETEIKLKRINKLLQEERKQDAGKEEFVFTKHANPIGTKEENLPVNNTNLSNGVIYKVQIGVYKKSVSPDIFKGLTPVFEETFPGGVKYAAGAFSHFSDAVQAKDYIKSMGLTGAFVIAYYKGKRVSIEEAKIHENE